MTFLNPVVLLGLIAASIPILIHLLNLRKLKRIDFSTLSFLKELQKNKIRKIKLKQWLLLAMRVLIIIFLVMAFARPALRGTSLAGAASSVKTTAIYVIDNTFSMGVIGGQGTYLNQAKENVKHLLRELQEGDEAAVILISNPDEEVKATTNLSELIKQVDNIQISYASGFIHNAVVKAAEIISESNNFNKELYLFTDLQENRITADNSVSDLSEVLNENVKLYLFNYAGKSVYNISVTDLKIQTQILEKEKPIVFDITVTNSGSEDAEDVVVSLFTNGERSSQKSVDIQSGSSVQVSMEVTLKSSGFIEFSAELEDDEIMQDNRRFVSVYVPEEIPVTMFYNNENDLRFVSVALNLQGENNPLKISGQSISQISSRNLSEYSTLVLSGAGDINGIQRIKSFVENGGGVLLMPSSASSDADFNILLSSLSLPISRGASGQKGISPAVNRFSKIDTDHPLFQNLFEKDKKQIESPDFYFSYRIFPSGTGREIISLTDGSSFISEYRMGKGRMMVMNSAPVLTWNNFPVKGIFAPLIYKSVLYLSNNQISEEVNLAGEPVTINLKGKSVPQLKITLPDGSSETINPDGEDYINYTKTENAGIYTISSNDILHKIPVNTDPAESVTKYISDDDFANYLNDINFRGNYTKIDVSGDAGNEINQARFGSELWKIFAVLTLLLALVEMTVARSLKRDLAVVK